jgi:hypothetical protein
VFLGSVLKVISAEQRVLQGHEQPQNIDRLVADAPFDIEAEYLDAIVVLPFHGLLSRIELLAFVDIFTTSITPPVYLFKRK